MKSTENSELGILQERISKLEDQNNALLQMVSKQSVLLESLIKILKPKKFQINIFPLMTMDDMKASEELLLEKPEEEILIFLKEKFGKRPLGKALKEMFTEEFFLKVNWGDALKDEYATYEKYVKAMKKVFFQNKAASYRKTYKQKTKTQQQKEAK